VVTPLMPPECDSVFFPVSGKQPMEGHEKEVPGIAHFSCPGYGGVFLCIRSNAQTGYFSGHVHYPGEELLLPCAPFAGDAIIARAVSA
jgi:hypothetical protein